MGTIACTIAGVSVTVLDASIAYSDVLEARSPLTLTVKDSAGTQSFHRGDPISIADSVLGLLYQGYVQTDDPVKTSADSSVTEIMHALTCTDMQYLFDKRTNSQNYTNWYSGDVAVDLVQRIASNEGITVAAALHADRTTSDFSKGILAGTVATSNTQDGDLELTPAGSIVNISEQVQADFLQGTLTSVTANAFSLTGATGNRVSPAYDLSNAGVLGSSHIHWNVVTGQNNVFTIQSSIDGGVTFQVCTNDNAIPGLFPGQNMPGQTLILKELFTSSDGSVATLLSVAVAIVPAAACAKSDVQYFAHTQSDWNAGTHNGTTAFTNNTLGIDMQSGFGTTINHFDTAGITSYFVSTGLLAYQGAGDSVQHSHNQFASIGTYTNMTYIVQINPDVDIFNNNADPSVPTYLNPSFSTSANSYGYWVKLDYTTVNPSGPGTTVTTYTLSLLKNGGTAIAGPTALTGSQVSITGQCAIKIVYTAATHNHKISTSDGNIGSPFTQIFNVTDASLTTGSNVGVYGATDGGGFSGQTYGFQFSGLFITANITGTASWVSPATSLASAVSYGNSLLRVTNTVPGSGLLVESSIDGGTNYATDTIDGALPSLTSGQSLSSASLVFRLTFTFVFQNTPIITALRALVVGFYSSSGTRTTVPTGFDTMTRGNVSGSFGTGTDGQTYAITGTGTKALTSNKALITNTTGDVIAIYGTRVITDQEGRIRFSLSASTISAELFLRWIDNNNYYRLSVSTTTITITRKRNGTSSTLATASITLATSTVYRMTFRALGYPTSLYGRVWADGTLEPTTWQVTAT